MNCELLCEIEVVKMDLVKINETKTLVSPIESTNEGKQTPPPDSADTAVDSSPLPETLSRKRTNDESWRAAQTPQTSPRTARFNLRRSVTLAVMPEHDGQPPRDNPFQSSGDVSQTQPALVEDNTSGPLLQSGNSFVTEINDYQQQLELEYQNFERSLNERDTSASLETMNWEELEKRYTEEISPCIEREKIILEEFNARFAVCASLAITKQD